MRNADRASTAQASRFSPRLVLRQATAPLRMTPDFIIVGAQKSGTSSLLSYISRHPAVAEPLRKEVHYFDLNHRLPFSWYKAHFPLRGSGQITGEASPYYLFHPLAAERVARALPKAKLIFILRQPGARAISQYWHNRRLGYETLELEAAFAAEESRLEKALPRVMAGESDRRHQHHGYVKRSMYSEQVARYLEHFPREQLFFASTDELVADPADLVARVVAFLGLPAAGVEDFEPRNVNPDKTDYDFGRTLDAGFHDDVRRLDALTGCDFYQTWFGASADAKRREG